MTVLCGGGASRPKAGFAQRVVLDATGINKLLTTIPLSWILPFAGNVTASISYDLSTVCNTDPPAMPVFTGDDMFALAYPFSDPVGAVTAAGKFYDLVKIYAWSQFCECVAVATPAPPLPPPAPVGLPQINPVVGSPPASTSGCYAGTFSGTPYQYATLAPPYPDVYSAPQLTPGWPAGPSINTAGPTANHTVTLPTPIPLQVRIDASIQFDAAATQLAYVNLRAWNAGQGSLGQLGFSFDKANGLSQTRSTLIAIPATAAYITINAAELDEPHPSQMQVTATWFCAGGASGAISTPCPPDPATAGILQQILGLVTLIQRQNAPFASVHGATHPGLTGSGHFAVQGLLGCAIAVTARPGYLGQTGSLPLELFDAGYITWSTADGYPHSERIEHVAQLSLPCRCSLYTDIAYDLPPGVTVAITEIAREP